MLKWSDCTEGDILLEAFLPEHDHDGNGWLLRAIRNGHVIAERSVSLTWRPTFGPDGGDVAALEAEIDRMLPEVSSITVAAEAGPYHAGPIQIAAPDPIQHAVLYNVLEDAREAARALEISDSELTQLLDLPEGCSLTELYPVALTEMRADRLQRLVAFHHLVAKHPNLAQSQQIVLAALQVGDLESLRNVLVSAGVAI